MEKAVAFRDKNNELNNAAGRLANDRRTPDEHKRALQDLITRTSAVHDALEALLR